MVLTRSSTRLRTFGSLMRIKARLSCSPSPPAINSITGDAASFSENPCGPVRWLTAPSKKYCMGTPKMREMSNSRPEPMRLAPFSYFLNLLKGQPQQFAESLLTHTDQHSPQSQAIADVRVGEIGASFRQGCYTTAPHARVTGAGAGRKALIRNFPGSVHRQSSCNATTYKKKKKRIPTITAHTGSLR